jgi:hypothetical protein|tara:strand:+ start:82 stop:375 length:294 start_codon:yes stop_codon:yes gene_type:complete
MIVRRCAQGHDVVIHKNNKPGMKKSIQLANGDVSTITYPSAAKDYFVWVDGEITKRSDSFKTCEEFYVNECLKKHSGGHGRIDIVKHKLVNNQVALR